LISAYRNVICRIDYSPPPVAAHEKGGKNQDSAEYPSHYFASLASLLGLIPSYMYIDVFELSPFIHL
jgi:hypothetical protein